MADIELVIKLSEEDYKNCVKYDALTSSIYKAIQKGTLLPKGHGRLGDLDALREEVSSWGMNDYEPSDFTYAIDQADTIIEADKNDKVDCEHTDCKNCVNHKYCDYEPFINKPCVSSGICEHDKNKVLDKIRAEIEQARYGLVNDGLDIALNIIDKYKAESEGEI